MELPVYGGEGPVKVGEGPVKALEGLVKVLGAGDVLQGVGETRQRGWVGELRQGGWVGEPDLVSESGLEGEGSLSTPLSVMQSDSTEKKKYYQKREIKTTQFILYKEAEKRYGALQNY